MDSNIFDCFFNNKIIACLITKYNGEIINYNFRAKKLFGFKKKIEYNIVDFYYNPERRVEVLKNIDNENVMDFKVKNLAGEIINCKVQSRCFKYEGEEVILSLVEDIEKEVRIEAELLNNQKVEKFSNEISKVFLDADINHMQQSIQVSLLKVMKYFGAERAYVIELNDNTQTYSFAGYVDKQDNNKNFLNRDIIHYSSWFYNKILSTDFIIYDRVEDIPDEYNEYLKSLNVDPMPFVGYILKNDKIPKIYLGIAGEKGHWPKESKKLLQSICETFYSLISKSETYFFYSIYKQAAEYLDNAIVYIDSSNKIRAFNESFLKLYFPHEKEIYGRHLTDVLQQNVLELLSNVHYKKCIEGENSYFELWNEFPDGRRLFVGYNLYPYRGVSNKVEGLVVIMNNKTDSISYETEILNLRESERQRLGMELHDDLAHDMLDIAINSNLLATEIEDSTNNKTIYNDAKKIEYKVNRTLDKIRTISRRLCSFYEFDPKIRNSAEIIKNKANDLGVEFEISGDVETVISNPFKAENIHHIMSECVINIIKHTNATKINFYVENIKNIINISLSGNGTKIKRKNGSSGIGQKIIKCRARLIEAAVEVDYDENGKSEIMINFDNSINGEQYV